MYRRFVLPTLAAALSVAACGDSTGPVRGPQFSQQITIEQFQGILAGGTVRVEIKAPAGTSPLIADELEVKGADEVTQEEEIESPVAALDLASDGCGGTLTLALGGIQVRFSAAETELEAERNGDLTCEEFVAAVGARLAAGVTVKAERDPAAAAQAPDDGSFVATKLELDDEADDPEIEINVRAANLLACSTLSSPPAGCLGVLEVLNVDFVLVAGTTELELEQPEITGEVDFEGVVASVEPGASCTVGTVTLVDGRVIEIVAGTEIEAESGDDDELDDLCQVKDALDNHQIVEAEGKGVVSDDDPLTIVAIEAELEVEEDPDDIAGEVDFKGDIARVERAGDSCTTGSVTFDDGTLIELVAGTDIDDDSGNDDRLGTLCEVEATLAAHTVQADGKGAVTAMNPLAFVATEVRFEIRD